MKKHFYLTITAILFLQLATGQNYSTEFQQALQQADTTAQLNILTKWKEAAPQDPELFTSFFNYYFLKSKENGIGITKGQPKGESFVITDSLDQVQGYIGNQVYYDQKDLQNALEIIEQGIALYPDRLDMRFGKIYVLGQVKDWDKFTSEIIRTIEYSSTNNNKWTWTNNELQQNGEDFFLSSLQDYQVQLYNTGKDALLMNMRSIAREILKYYPNNIESLSNLSITYLLTGEYDKGLEPLLKAEKITPTDYIVLSNIAQGYRLKGDKEKAVEYYEKTAKYGDDRAKEFAKIQIEELKK